MVDVVATAPRQEGEAIKEVVVAVDGAKNEKIAPKLRPRKQIRTHRLCIPTIVMKRNSNLPRQHR